MRGLHGCGHAELGEARRDRPGGAAAHARCAAGGRAAPSARASPRARPARRGWRRRRSRALRGRGPRRRSARPGRAAPRRSAAASPSPASANGSSIEAVREPSVPSANALTGPMRSHSSPRPLRSPSAMIVVQPLGRERGPDAQREPAARRAAAATRASPCSRWKSWMPGHAARVRLAHAARDRLVEHARPGGGESPPRRPRRPSRAARRWAAPAASRSTTGASPIGSRASAADESQAVWWSCAHSSTGRSPQAASSALAVRLPGRRPASAPRASPRRSASRRRRAPRPRRPPAPRRASASPRGRAAPSDSDHSRKCTCASVKPGTTQRPSEVDALVRDERAIALAHVDAAADAVARDRDRARERKPGIARAHAAVVEDHAAEGSPRRCSVAIVRAAVPASRRGDRAPSRGVPGRPGARRPRRRAARAVGRPRLSQRHGAERAPGRAGERRAAAARAARPRARARRERARAASSRSASLRALPRGAGLGRPARAAAPRPRARRRCRPPSYLRYRELLPGAEIGRLHAGAVVGALAQERVGADAHPRRLRADAGRDGVRAGAARARHAASATCSRELARHMRKNGHEGTIRFRGINAEFFFGQVLAGESGAVPGPTETPLHGPGLSTAQGRGPSRRPLREGDAVVVDISGPGRGLRLGSDAHVLRPARADPVLLEAYETCRRILRRMRRAAAAGHAGERALRARRSRSRARPGTPTASWAPARGA